jgi:hypothetical protein
MLELQVGDTVKYLETIRHIDGKVAYRGSYVQVTVENLYYMNHFNNKSVIKVQGIPDHG